MSELQKKVLLLTATIEPKQDQPQLSIKDSSTRYQQYEAALDLYRGLLKQGTIDGIVFVDNSGYDLSGLRARFNEPEIEFISYYGLDYPSNYHRGYGEFKLIEYAHNRSTILTSLSVMDSIIKVTGRYRVLNLSAFLNKVKEYPDLLVNIRGDWVDMELMAWSLNGYSELIQYAAEEFKGGMAPELKMNRMIRAYCSSDRRVITKFTYPLLIKGIRGTDGKSFIGRFGYIRHYLKVIMFWLRELSQKN